MVHPFEAVEIIEIPPTDAPPQLGRQSTDSLCKAFKVKNQKQVEKIDEIKDIVYKQGFANGMIFFFLNTFGTAHFTYGHKIFTILIQF